MAHLDKLSACAVLCAVGAWLGVAPAVAQQDSTPVRVANLDIGPFMPVAYVAKLASQYGVNVQMTAFRRGLEAAQAVSADAADVGVGGVEAAVSAVAAGSPAVILAGGVGGGIGWVARKGTSITTIAELRGHKFAVISGLHELVMRLVFEKAGLSYSTERGKDVQVVFINSPPALNTAVRAGDVDAASAPEPFASKLMVDGTATALPPPYGTPLGKLPRAIFMRRDYLAKHPDVAQRLVTAYVAAMKVFRDQPAVARDFVVNDALKGAMTAQDWDLSVKNETFDVALDVPLVQAFVDNMLRFDMIKKTLDAKMFTDFTLLPKAKAEAHW